MKDKSYFKRMPEEKIEKILLYNEQDVVNLYYIYVNWKKYIIHNIDENMIENLDSESVDINVDNENQEENDEIDEVIDDELQLSQQNKNNSSSQTKELL